MRLLFPVVMALLTNALLAGGIHAATPVAVHAQTSPQASATTTSGGPLTAKHPALRPYKAVYTARYNRFPIEAHRRLQLTEGGYEIITEASNFLGRILEKEQFRLDNHGRLIPGNYVYDRSIMGKSRKETIAVDPSAGISTTHRKGEENVLDFEVGQLGPLSYQIAMARDLAAGKKDLNYTVIHRGRLREYRYQVLEQTKLDTPLGKLDTVKIERMRESDERETLLWLAPELNYLPVKLIQHEDGETYEMTIKSFTLES